MNYQIKSLYFMAFNDFFRVKKSLVFGATLLITMGINHAFAASDAPINTALDLPAQSAIVDDAPTNQPINQVVMPNKAAKPNLTTRPSVTTKQSVASVKAKVTEFLKTQTIGYPGEVKVSVGAVDPNLKLSICQDLQAFLPTGSHAWGKTSVGVQCGAPNPWTIYVQATVNVWSQYLVAAAPLAQGMSIGPEHLMFENGDLTQLPAGIFTEMTQAIGRTVSMSIPAGTVLRQENLKLAPVVQRGQSVTLTSTGQGFKVAAEGQALANANEGQVVQVKVASGQVVMGIARVGGQIEVKF